MAAVSNFPTKPLDPKFLKLMSAAQPEKPFVTCAFIGPQDVGKTVFAATVSAQCPEILPAKVPTELTDIAWLGVDNHSLLGLRSMGLSVRYAVDLPGMLAENSTVKVANLQVALNTALEAIAAFVLQGGCKYIVVDTITLFDALVQQHVSDLKITGPAFYGNVMALHTQLTTSLARLPAHRIYLAHEKAVLSRSADGDDKNVKAKKEVQEQEGLEEGDMDLALYYHASKLLYLGDCALQGEVRNDYTMKNSATCTQRKRVVHFLRKGARTKNKFAHLINAEEAPNLRAIFTKAGLI